MRSINIAALAGLFIATVSAPAASADLRGRVLPPAPVVDDSPGGWYLRGDLGFVDHKRPAADFSAVPSSGSLVHEGFGDTAVAGFGAGYRFSPHLRADVTLDHRFNTRFRGVAAAPAFAAGSLMDTGLFQSSTLMVNGYLDVGTVNGFTPYLGAGIGVARNVLSNYARTTSGAAATASWTRLSGDNGYDLAWALMTGIGYQLSAGFSLDLGYRYVSLGDLKTGTYGGGTGMKVESIGAHEVRLGVRYAFP